MWRGGAWVMRTSVVEGMEDQMDRPFGSEREEGEALVVVMVVVLSWTPLFESGLDLRLVSLDLAVSEVVATFFRPRPNLGPKWAKVCRANRGATLVYVNAELPYLGVLGFPYIFTSLPRMFNVILLSCR